MDHRIAAMATHLARTCRDANASLAVTVAQLNSVQRKMEDVRLGCEATSERSRETIAVIDRFFEIEPEQFLAEMRQKMREFLLDSSRSQHRAAYEQLLRRID